MASRAAVRRRKREMKEAATLAGLPGLAEVKKRQPNGQARVRADSPHDPRKTALQARVRQFGGKDSKKAREAMSGQHSGDHIGMVIQSQCSEQKARKLWATLQAWRGAHTRYQRTVLGISEGAKGSSLETNSGGGGGATDTRTEDEKVQDATKAWMIWNGHIGYLSTADRVAAHEARIDDPGLWDSQKPTRRGLAALAAIEALHKIVEG